MLFLLACNVDNELNDKPDDPGFEEGDSSPAVSEPAITVDPEWLDEGVLCGPVERTITVQSTGTSDLTITAVTLSGDGWTAEPPSTPLVLASGSSVEIPVSGGPGDATLRIESDAEDIDVPLYAAADQPPTVTLVTPSAGEVLPVADTVFTAIVSDDVDPPETLALAWSSSVEGVLGTDPAAADGTALYDWVAAAHTSGDHVIYLEATDSCGNASSAHVGTCQQAGYLEDNIDLESWHFEGMANWDSTNGWLELTEPLTDQLASAFNVADLVGGDEVEISFLFYVSGGSGADGISLTALDVDRMTSYLGAAGGSIGYGASGSTPGLPGWSIEVDTYDNGRTQDPTDQDHVMFTFDGDPSGAIAWAPLPEMEDGAWHTMTVTVSDPHVTVNIDGTDYIDTDISGYFGFPAYVGFTAATGSLTNFHLIDALEVTQYVCEE